MKKVYTESEFKAYIKRLMKKYYVSDDEHDIYLYYNFTRKVSTRGVKGEPEKVSESWFGNYITGKGLFTIKDFSDDWEGIRYYQAFGTVEIVGNQSRKIKESKEYTILEGYYITGTVTKEEGQKLIVEKKNGNLKKQIDKAVKILERPVFFFEGNKEDATKGLIFRGYNIRIYDKKSLNIFESITKETATYLKSIYAKKGIKVEIITKADSLAVKITGNISINQIKQDLSRNYPLSLFYTNNLFKEYAYYRETNEYIHRVTTNPREQADYEIPKNFAYVVTKRYKRGKLNVQ